MLDNIYGAYDMLSGFDHVIEAINRSRDSIMTVWFKVPKYALIYNFIQQLCMVTGSHYRCTIVARTKTPSAYYVCIEPQARV